MAAFVDLTPTSPRRARVLRLVLHAAHRQLARVVERLRERGALSGSRPTGSEPLPERLVRDVVDADADRERHGAEPGAHERPEVRTREIARERARRARSATPRRRPRGASDGRADGGELGVVPSRSTSRRTPTTPSAPTAAACCGHALASPRDAREHHLRDVRELQVRGQGAGDQPMWK